ncbi:MAG: zinc ABC transporter substrate-binding protein [Lachnospiraceae bacterium]|nr:zinc ABC transporter substrate-binding protein [Lachnospiraceae bacterium]
MKKIISLLLAALLCMGALTACESAKAPKADDGRIKIVTTIFPEYDWVMNVLGDKKADADVTILLDNGVDLHNYQPTVEDIVKISEADLFIYVGGESDEWVEDVLKGSVNDKMIVINLMDVLGDAAKEEEVIEGMECEEEEEEGEEGEEIEYDEHVWLSLKNASLFVNEIEIALETIDEANATAYRANASEYIEKINNLDADYEKAVSEAETKMLLFGDRFPFRYMVDDYNLSYYAAFVGCSTETEASFKTVTFLAEKMDENSLKAVMTIEGNDHKIAETIIQNTESKDQKVLTLNSMQSVTAGDIKEGATYLSIMEKNLEVLKEALQ